MEESEIEGIEVENQEMENSQLEENETGEDDTEKSDQLEDCDKMLEITAIFQLKVSTFDYEHPPVTSFYQLYTTQ